MKPLFVFSDVTVHDFVVGNHNDLDFGVDAQLNDELTGQRMSTADMKGFNLFPVMGAYWSTAR